MMLVQTPVVNNDFSYKTYLDVRFRYERRLNRDFFSPANDNRNDLFTRVRPGIEWKYGANWSGAIEYQFAHDEIWRIARTSSDEASDLNLAYAKYKNDHFEITIGRQKINLGNERLIGALEWSMTGRAFDGIRLKTGRWDAYAFKVGVAHPKPGRTRIAGASYTSPYGLSSLIFKHDDQAKPATDHWTLTHLWQQKQGDWNYEVEAAYQNGRVTGKNLRAWALHGLVGHTFSKSTKGYLELNAASGGGNANTTNTFDNLLPTNHKFYGSMDLQSWRNMREIAIGIDHQLNPKWSLKTHLHSFSLSDSTDAWYGAGGGANQGPNGAFVDPTGNSGSDIGRELDIEFVYKHNPRMTFSGGVGAFFPGGFVKARNGGRADTQFWMFVGAQFRF